MPVGAVVTVVKEMPYRGEAAEEWSNTYGFDGPTPPDNASWRAWFDQLVAQEKTLYFNTCQVIGGYGYIGWPTTDNHAVWGVDLRTAPNTPVPGTLSDTTASQMAGDQAAWVRWEVDRRSTKGKPIYLRKYFHHGAVVTGGGDALSAAYITALEAFGQELLAGTGISFGRICDPGDATVLNAACSQFVTTRTLERRGKRPLPNYRAPTSAA